MIKRYLTPLFFLIAITTFTGCNNENKESTPPDNQVSVNTGETEAIQADPENFAAVSVTTNKHTDIDESKLLRKGKILFLQCRACHSLELDGEHLVGPNLNALFDSQAASKEGFAYSEAMTQSGIKWNEETLDQFLIKPSAYVPETIMAFVGVEKAEDRAALILYLKENT